jgi:inorganic triphosphatase YgiF
MGMRPEQASNSHSVHHGCPGRHGACSLSGMGQHRHTKLETEVELKLLARDRGLLDDLWGRDYLWGWRVVGRGHERQRNVYYDTPDGALQAQGASLRWRSQAGQDGGEFTLKTRRARQGCVFRRQELTSQEPEVAEADRHDLPEPLAAAEQLAGQTLAPVLELETDRRTMMVERGASRLEVALDQVALPGTEVVEHEIEAEVVEGNATDLLGLQAALLATGETMPAKHGKRGRALRHLARHCPPGVQHIQT